MSKKLKSLHRGYLYLFIIIISLSNTYLLLVNSMDVKQLHTILTCRVTSLIFLAHWEKYFTLNWKMQSTLHTKEYHNHHFTARQSEQFCFCSAGFLSRQSTHSNDIILCSCHLTLPLLPTENNSGRRDELCIDYIWVDGHVFFHTLEDCATENYT